MGPLNINATALSAFEIQVSWDPVQQLSANSILRGYEVRLEMQAVAETGQKQSGFTGLMNNVPGEGLSGLY